MSQLPNHSCLVPPKTSWCIQLSCEHIRNDAGFTVDQPNVIKRCIWVSHMELLHMFRHLNCIYVDSIIVPFAFLAVVTRQSQKTNYSTFGELLFPTDRSLQVEVTVEILVKILNFIPKPCAKYFQRKLLAFFQNTAWSVRSESEGKIMKHAK